MSSTLPGVVHPRRVRVRTDPRVLSDIPLLKPQFQTGPLTQTQITRDPGPFVPSVRPCLGKVHDVHRRSVCWSLWPEDGPVKPLQSASVRGGQRIGSHRVSGPGVESYRDHGRDSVLLSRVGRGNVRETGLGQTRQG